MSPSTAARSLFIGNPDPCCAPALSRRKRKRVRRWRGDNMVQMALELSALAGCFQVLLGSQDQASAEMRIARSTATAEWVSAPTDTKSTPACA